MAVDNIVYKVVALTVFILITATCLIPVVQDAQSEQYTTDHNTSEYYYIKQNIGPVTITIDNQDKVYVNSIEMSTPDNTSDFRAFAFADDFCIYNSASNNVLYISSDYNDETISTSDEITIDNGTIAFGVYEIPFTGQLYYAANDGDYGVFDLGDTNLKFNEDSDLFLFTSSTVAALDNERLFVFAHGVYDDLQTLFAFVDAEGATDFKLSISQVVDDEDGVLGLSSSSRVDISYKLNGTEKTTYTTTSTVIAPIEYSFTTSSDESTISLLGIIPLMVIIAAIMLAVGMLRGRS